MRFDLATEDQKEEHMTEDEGQLETANAMFDQYVERMLPAALREGSPTPESWGLGALAWATFTEGARKLHRVEAKRTFVLAVSQRGYTPQELASGELPKGVEITVATGKVRRFTPDLDEATQSRARKAIAAGIGHLDDVARYYIECAVTGRLPCAPVTLAAVLEQAERGAGVQEPSQPLIGR